MLEGSELIIDTEMKIIKIQVRTLDGSRVIIKANPSNTILQLYQHLIFITKIKTHFKLFLQRPVTLLSNMSDTLAGISGASILMK